MSDYMFRSKAGFCAVEVFSQTQVIIKQKGEV